MRGSGSPFRISLALAGYLALAFVSTMSTHASSLVKPTNLSPPVLSGTAVVGQVLSSSTGSWSGTQPIRYGFQWYRCDSSQRCIQIAGARSSSYSLTAGDVGNTVYALVTAANMGGQASSGTLHTAAVASAATAPTNGSAPVVSGWPIKAGTTLSATPGTWSGTTPITYTYSWKRCDVTGVTCTVVATGSNQYKLGTADVSSTLMITVGASNTAGSASASSVETARIAPATPVVTSKTLFGVHSDLTWYGDQSYHAAVVKADSETLHAQLSRNSLLWHLIEPQRSTFDWATTDDVVDKLVAAGIKPEFTVYGSPSWANGVSRSTADYYLYVPQSSGAFQQWVNDYAAFLQTAAARYAGKVNLWECGNEENEHYFWKPAPNVVQYLTWYKACRAAILAGNPQAQVAVGGLAGLLFAGGGDIDGRSFLRQLIAAGARIDHVAIHPYAVHDQSPAVHVPWDGNFDDIGQIRDFLDSQGLQNVDIWVTEWGWDSGTVGTQTQSDDVQKSLQMLKTHFPYVTYAFYFCDFDRSGYGQGLLDSSLNPKPAATAFAQFVLGN